MINFSNSFPDKAWKVIIIILNASYSSLFILSILSTQILFIYYYSNIRTLQPTFYLIFVFIRDSVAIVAFNLISKKFVCFYLQLISLPNGRRRSAIIVILRDTVVKILWKNYAFLSILLPFRAAWTGQAPRAPNFGER